jgi:adenine-specific DNA-methyltransferase
MPRQQLMLNLPGGAEPALFELGTSDEMGQVFTRPWVVNLILDLVGYTADRDLAALVALEPACGEGAFLGPIIDRLISSSATHGHGTAHLMGALRALDLSEINVERARKFAVVRLVDHGIPIADAEILATKWIRQGDFILDEDVEGADFVLGNPPYIRLENVPPARTAAYRAACPTMKGRSDVYVGFIERGLRLLREEGVLGFIVADRWMHNQYGRELRRLVGDGFSVETVIEMHEVDAFEDDVSAYPAVTVIRRRPQARAVLVTTDGAFGAPEAERMLSWAQHEDTSDIRAPRFRGARLDSWFRGEDLWPSGDPTRLALVRDLERRFPPLENASTGTRVGIGVATGADSVYITRDPDCVEQQRLLPLVIAKDVVSGHVDWSGSFLVSPWENGHLVNLARYPRLASYFYRNEARIRSRHIAARRPESWYRTIDRVDPNLQGRPKLLLPDLKAASHPVIDDGQFYPHHNLYFITSDRWDMAVLGGLLLSGIADLFVGTYCVKMRGGCYRYQAQYLRRIRVPDPSEIGVKHRRALTRAFEERDVAAANAAAIKIFGIDPIPGWS